MASHCYGYVSSQLETHPPTLSENTYASDGSFGGGLHASELLSRSQIGGRIHCDWPKCPQTFTRSSDLARHRKTIHRVTERFWCMIQGCNRSESYSGQKQPFSRKDKRNEHVRRVHKAPKRNGDGDLAYITRNDATSTPQTIEDTSMGPFTDTAWRSRAARLPELAPFHDAARLVGVTDLTGPGEFAGFTGVDISTRPLGPTSLYGPSTFSDAASIAGAADATAFTGFAGFANDSGSMAVTGFPSVDVSGWLSAGSEFTRLTGVDGSIANEGVPDVGGYAAVGTFTTDDEFGWFTSVSTFNEFGGIDISTDLNHETSAPHLNDALESIDSAM